MAQLQLCANLKTVSTGVESYDRILTLVSTEERILTSY